MDHPPATSGSGSPSKTGRATAFRRPRRPGDPMRIRVIDVRDQFALAASTMKYLWRLASSMVPDSPPVIIATDSPAHHPPRRNLPPGHQPPPR